MKKIILIILCFVLLLSGCEQLQKAEPYYTETIDEVTLSTRYEYYFEDESNILCIWKNETDKEFLFQDPFELHILGDDGEWYRVSKGEEASFDTDHCHGVNPKSEANHRFELSVYTKGLKNGEKYRISTYCYDDDGNYYQVYAEFICSNELAEAEMKEISGGSVNKRIDPENGGTLEIITGEE